MINKIMKPCLFCIGFIMLYILSGEIVLPKWYANSPAIEGYRDKYAAFYEEKNNSLDVIFLGPSTSQQSFLPIELYKQYGITSYVLSSAAQLMPISYYYLEEAAKTQAFKTVVLDPTMLVRDFEYSKVYYANQNYKSITSMKNSATKWKAYWAVKDNESNMMKWIDPVYNFHSRWNLINADDFRINRTKGYPEYCKGACISYNVAEYWGGKLFSSKINCVMTDEYVQNYYSNDEKDIIEFLYKQNEFEIDPYQAFFFEKIADFCKQHHIELICAKGPTAVTWAEEHYRLVNEYLEDRDIPYIDYVYGEERLDIDWNTETSDHGQHVNYFGAKKCTAAIGEYLTGSVNYKDHRGDEDYSQWEDALQQYEMEISESLSSGDEKAYRFLKEISQDKQGKIILIAVQDDVAGGWNDIYQFFMQQLDIDFDFYNNYRCSFVAWIEDGEVKYCSGGDDIEIYNDVVRDLNGLHHKVNLASAGMGQGNYSNIYIDNVDYSKHLKGLNIVVWNKQTACVENAAVIDTFDDGYFYQEKG